LPVVDALLVCTIVTSCSVCRQTLVVGLAQNEMDVEVLGITELLARHLAWPGLTWAGCTSIPATALPR